jgi:molecular chaperone GrpE
MPAPYDQEADEPASTDRSVSAEDAAAAAEREQQVLRAAADLTNQNRRLTAQVAKVTAEAPAKVIKAFLPTIDNLERALAAADGSNPAHEAGIVSALGGFYATMRSFGVEEIAAQSGELFNPEHHEAIFSLDRAQPCEIHEVLGKGFVVTETGLVLRPVQVSTVAVGTAAKGVTPPESPLDL